MIGIWVAVLVFAFTPLLLFLLALKIIAGIGFVLGHFIAAGRLERGRGNGKGGVEVIVDSSEVGKVLGVTRPCEQLWRVRGSRR